MAVTITLDMPRPVRLEKGNGLGLAILTGTITDSSYATGGTALTGISSKFNDVLRIMVDSKLGYVAEFVAASNKLLVYEKVDAVAGTRAEVANAADISAAAFSFIAIGRM
jgi:hypothetical protein